MHTCTHTQMSLVKYDIFEPFLLFIHPSNHLATFIPPTHLCLLQVFVEMGRGGVDPNS